MRKSKNKLRVEALDFIQYLQSKNLSPNTQKSYTRYVDLFLKWYAKRPLVLSEVEVNCNQKDILDYLAYLKNKKHQAPITRKNNLIALSHYFTYLQKQTGRPDNPTHLIKIRGTKRKTLYHIYTLEELIQLSDDYNQNYIQHYNDTHTPQNQREASALSRHRNHILLSLLIHQGLNTAELERIHLEHLDLNKAQIHITGSKKSNPRNIPLHASQIGGLILYLQNIRPQYLDYQQNVDTQNLLLPLPEAGKKKTSSTTLKGTLKQLTAQTKTLDKDFQNFKQIRASVITYWIKSLGLRKAQYLAGHRYISSTENYLSNDLENLTDDIEKYNPY